MGTLVEKEQETVHHTEIKTMKSRSLCICVFMCMLCSAGSHAERFDRVPFCIDVEPLDVEGRLFLAGKYTTIDMVWKEAESSLFFYEFEGDLKRKGVFNGDFSSACSAGNSIYIVEQDKGVSRYSVSWEKGESQVSYEDYTVVPDDMKCLNAASDGIVPIFLMYHTEDRIAVIMKMAGRDFFPHEAYTPYRVEKHMVDTRLVRSRKGVLVSWRAEPGGDISAVLWTGEGWRRIDFTGTECNEYDISEVPELFYIERQEHNKKNTITCAELSDAGWGEGKTIPLPDPGYAEKYGRIRVTEREVGDLVLVRSHYLPFGINGTDIFARSSSGWEILSEHQPLLLSAVKTGGLFLVFMTVLAAVLKKWLPMVLYREIRTVKVGSLFSRAGGYLIDSVIVLIFTLFFMNVIRFQDMDAGRYIYVMYTVFWISLFVYGMIVEALTGRTVGKAILGLYLRNKIGMKCTLREIFVRNILKVFEATTLIIPAFSIIMTSENQRIGDLLAGTRVQKREEYGI